ncbi:hypothetical protein Q5P01_009958 [Channa striata]|uniref:Uncharacterized protein n=1 Tax=Channa striata TaxID=64152 RepID=A0AA88MX66_CHASR|nr:hypothetical protein Q5P01_009958 [Channa striata]
MNCGLVNAHKEPVPLKSIDVELEVRDHVATVVSTLNYENKEDKPLEAVFVFPLPGDAAVCHFSAKIGQTEIVAEVKEKQQAREEYDNALSSGQQAFLLEESDQSPDIFSLSVGSLPPGESASIRLEYVTELAVQADDGLRFCLPAVLNPRYQPHGSEAASVQVTSVPASLVSYSLSFSARVSSPRPITKVESSSSLDPLQYLNTEQTQAMVRLAAGHKFDRDVELLIYYKDAHQPTAVVEAGRASAKPGTLMGDPVVMVSLYPEFPQAVMSTVASRGEFVFLLDRSGSMGCAVSNENQRETRIGNARDTLLLLLKSLPMGCYFNIYSFGSSYEHVFPKSVKYSETTMEKALKKVEEMDADLGGTEILEPLKQIYSQSCIPNQPRQLFVFTDGEVENTKEILNLVKKNSSSHRCFSFGIGEGASSALINALATEGGGHAQFITGTDRMQTKVMQSLRFALQPVVENISVTWDLPKGASVTVLSPPITSIFQGQRSLVYAQLSGQSSEAAEACVTVKYSLAGHLSQNQLHFSLKPAEDTGLTVHRLAARTLIRSLEMEEREHQGQQDGGVKEKVVELSVQSGVSSSFTAFVAVNKSDGNVIQGPLVRRDVPCGNRLFLLCLVVCSVTLSFQLIDNATQCSFIHVAPYFSEPRPSLFSYIKTKLGSFCSKSSKKSLQRDGAENSQTSNLHDTHLPKQPPRDPLLKLVSLQKASGCWLLDPALAAALKKTRGEVEKAKPASVSQEVWATILALIWLHGFKMDAKDEWEILAIKAVSWLHAQNESAVNLSRTLNPVKVMNRCGLITREKEPVPLKSIDVELEVRDHVATVVSTLNYENKEDKPLEAVFIFPLPGDAAVCHFSAKIGQTEIVAEVKEKQQAREEYDDALSSGQQAFLLEESDQSPDIFSLSVGSLPPGESASIRLEYVTELAVQADDGLRFCLPAVLNPRYQPQGSEAASVQVTSVPASLVSYSLSFSAQVSSPRPITKVESSSSLDPLQYLNTEQTQAMVRLAAGHKFDRDVELLIYYKDAHQPTAVVEAGRASAKPGTLMGDPVVMVSLYPEFPQAVMSTVASRGEFVFLLDRSGSMDCPSNNSDQQETRIGNARDTLLLLLKSLPMGCYFNIYSFGSNYEHVFPKSVEYSETTMEEALKKVGEMGADLGGTEILEPLKHIYSQSCIPNQPRQLFVFTDGEVWNTKEIFELVKKNSGSHRCFSFGIGEGASSALINGLAKEGRGHAQFITGNDRMQTKVMQSLRFALQPAVENISVTWDLPKGVSVTVLSPPITSIFQGQRSLVYAQLSGQSSEAAEGCVTVKYSLAGHLSQNQLHFSLKPAEETGLPVHRLGARSLIRSLEMEKGEDGGTPDEEVKKKVVELSVQSGVSSAYTAFIAVNKGNNETIQGPLVRRNVPIPMMMMCCSAPIPYSANLRDCGLVVCDSVQMQCLVASEDDDVYEALEEDVVPKQSRKDPLLQLVSLQKASGCWLLDPALAAALGKSSEEVEKPKPAAVNKEVWATILALIWLHAFKKDAKDEWELLAMKAVSWLHAQNGKVMNRCGLITREKEPVPLKSIDVELEVRDHVATVVSTLNYENKEDKPLEAVFVFPLPGDAAVCHFSAKIGQTEIVAEVKEKQQERASIRLEYVTELAVQADDGLRFCLPAVLNPRYQPHGSEAASVQVTSVPASLVSYSLSFSARVSSPRPITKVESSSSLDPLQYLNTEQTQAMVRLAAGHKFDRDVELLIYYKDAHQATAVVEAGRASAKPGTLMGDPVVMVSLYPEFPQAVMSTVASRGEFVFLLDRSGSMGCAARNSDQQETRIGNARDTLLLLLKSLPMGCYFNIYSFGSTYEHVFPKSVEYSETTMKEALKKVGEMDADLGGTEILRPLQHIYSQSCIPNQPRQLFVFTDGEVGNTKQILELVKKNSGSHRCFSFGIGEGASSALINGLAKEGGGHAQFITGNDRMQTKVMQSLRFALQPAVENISVTWDLPKGASVTVLSPPITSIFQGQRSLVYAQLSGQSSEAAEGCVTVKYSLAGHLSQNQLHFSLKPAEETGLPVHRLGARSLIRSLEMEKGEDGGTPDEEVKKKVVELSVQSGVSSAYTAFIAVNKGSNETIQGPLVRRNVPVPMMMMCCSAPIPYSANLRDCGLVVCDSVEMQCDMALEDDDVYEALEEAVVPKQSRKDPLLQLVSLQKASGCWLLDPALAAALGKSSEEVEKPKPAAVNKEVWATILALIWLHAFKKDAKDEWELLAMKAVSWLHAQNGKVMNRCGLITREKEPVPLKSIDVELEVRDHVATVVSTLNYENKEDKPLEAVFVFPLPGDAAVCHFSAKIGQTEIVAEVKEKQQAREQYDDALSSGQQAFLLEESDQSPDIFSLSVGSLPPGESASIRLEYVTELAVQADDGLRFCLPAVLNPRYQPHGSEAASVQVTSVPASLVSYSLSFSAQVSSPRPITKVESSSSLDPLQYLNTEQTQAMVRLAAGHKFDRDVELLIYYKDAHQPTAVVEAGRASAKPGTLMGDPVVMVSLYPEFPQAVMSTVASRGEFVFLLDRSGSMDCPSNNSDQQETRIGNARDTLLLLLKSLPMGCYFNIYSFGSTYEHIFPKSVEYSETTMEEALKKVGEMGANLGGTEILRPLQHIYSQSCIPNQPRQLFVFTDGEVRNTKQILELVKKNSVSHRCFSFGIGEGASSALINGLAKEGGGQAQFITGNDRMQTKVMQSLRFALQPAVENISVTWDLPKGVSVTVLSPPITSIFQGQRSLVYAQLSGQSSEAAEGCVTVKYSLAGHLSQNQLHFSLKPAEETGLPVHRLGARSLIRSLEMEKGEDGGTPDEEVKKKVVELSVQSGVSSAYTAFIAVNKGNNETIQGPLVRRNVPVPMMRMTGGIRPVATMMRSSCEMSYCPPVGFRLCSVPKSAGRKKALRVADFNVENAEVAPVVPKQPPRDPLLQLVSLQKASGCWLLDPALAAALGKSSEEVEKTKPAAVNKEVWATILALIWLHGFKTDAKDEWELLAMKAVSWLHAQNVPLKSIDVELEVRDHVATVVSTLNYENKEDKPLEAVFVFPLPGDAAVCHFSAKIGQTEIVAEVKEKQQAREEYDDALSSGQQAFLLEESDQSPDIFSLSVGSLPPGESASIRLEYVTELAVQADDGLRFCLPAVLNPRYQPQGSEAASVQVTSVPASLVSYSLSFSARVSSPRPITKIESSSSLDPLQYVNTEQTQAMVRLAAGHKFDRDVELLIYYKDAHQPTAVVEAGRASAKPGTLMGDPVVMVSLYPEFPQAVMSTVASRGEFVFLLDRSGSMDCPSNNSDQRETRIGNARDTLLLLLKSLPMGCYFNIYSFGSTYEHVFPKSVEYSETTMEEALKKVGQMGANLGGTEILKPLKHIYSQSCIPNQPRQLFVFTDGEVGNTKEVLNLVKKNSSSHRCFSFGIGEGASSALIKGLATEGGGHAQFITGTDRMQTKVMQSLRFALQPAAENISVTWDLPKGASVTVLSPPITLLFQGQRSLVYAQLSGQSSEAAEGCVTVKYSLAGHLSQNQLHFSLKPAEETGLPVHRLGARSLIRSLEMEKGEDGGTPDEEVKKKVVELSVQSGVSSAYTAFIAVNKGSNETIQGPLVRRNVPVPNEDLYEAIEEDVLPIQSRKDPLLQLVSLQKASGCWLLDPALAAALGKSSEEVEKPKPAAVNKEVWATILALIWLHAFKKDAKDEWELLAMKAVSWLHAQNVKVMNRCGLITREKEPVPLKSIDVELEVRDHVATVVSTLNYENKEDKPLEAVFVFPLPGDAAVCHFSAKIGQTEIVAEVKEKQQAREEYDDALSSGQQAFLLEESDQSPDIFSLSVGSLPPGESASIRLEYVTELAVQADDGLRFCLPAVLNPRYQPQGSEAASVQVTSVPASLVSYSLSFSAQVSSPRPITKVESSSSLDPLQYLNTEQTQAMVRLAAGHKFDRDVELLIYYKDAHQPTAVVEAGRASAKPGTLMGDPVVMVSLYPEFPQAVMSTVASRGEFVFLLDRSGSMGCAVSNENQRETRIGNARDTLLLLLKSLPMGCYFNIYSFGSNYEHVFPKSVEYSETTMEEALKKVGEMGANLGGTEILRPLQHIYSQSCIPNQPRQLFVFTDGEVGNTKQILELVKKNSGSHRCFSFGIGEGASSALINGLAKEGGGQAQFITGNDRMQTKVMQSLQFALQPAVENISVTWDLPKGVSVTVLSPPITSIFQGQRSLVYAQLSGQSSEAAEGCVTVKYSLAGHLSQNQLHFSLKPAEETGLPVHRLGARSLIRSLEMEKGEDGGTPDEEVKRSNETIQGPLVRRNVPVPRMRRYHASPPDNARMRKSCARPQRDSRMRRYHASPPEDSRMRNSLYASPPDDANCYLIPPRRIQARCVADFDDKDEYDDIEVPVVPKQPPRDPLLQLVSLQKASGCWLLDPALAAALGKSSEEVENPKPAAVNKEVWATILALIWLHGFKTDAKDEWELLAMKAVSWLHAQNAPSVKECVEAGNALLGCTVQEDAVTWELLAGGVEHTQHWSACVI